MPAPLILRIIGDASSYVKTAELTIGTNTKIGASFKQVGVNANLSADAQIRAAVKAQEALRANAVALQTRASSLPGGSREQVAATLLAAQAQEKYARSIGITTTNTHAMAGASSKAEREISKATRGALAGSGVFGHLGRSLLLASSGFVAFEAGALIIERSIAGAENLEKAQRSLDVAIEHTGGAVGELTPKYLATARAAAQFGQSQAEALTGLARATVLTGNAEAAQRAYQEALVISKATGKDFNAVLTAAAKGQEGITTSLRRYGILLDSTASGQEQFTQVMERFGGQAEANTTASERLDAAVANFEATLGTALLPTFNRLATRLTNWLTQMEKSGKLQRDVNRVVTDAGHVFHVLGVAIHVADRITGSFENTVKALIGLKVASVFLRWSGALRVVTADAVVAEGAMGGLRLSALRLIGPFGLAAAAVYGLDKALARVTGFDAIAKAWGSAGWLADNAAGDKHVGRNPYAKGSSAYFQWMAGFQGKTSGSIQGNTIVPTSPYWQEGVRARDRGGPRGPLGPATGSGTSGIVPGAGGTGGAKPFDLSYHLRLAEAIASATRSTRDDLSVARQEAAYIRGKIPHLHGEKLIAAYQLLASVNATIASDVQHAAKKGKEAQEFVVSDRLQIAEARAQALGLSDRGILLKIKAAAQRALKAGKLSAQGQIDAWNEIAQVNERLASSSKSALGGFKQLSINKIVSDLHLSAEDAKKLRSQLSQVGPHGTVPRGGVGAYGYAIGGGGTVHHHHHHHVEVDIDGRQVESRVRHHKHKRQRRNSSQRRGPNAGWDD